MNAPIKAATPNIEYSNVAASPLDRRDFDRRDKGVTARVVLLCLALAAMFGYIIPIIDIRLQNSFLGAQHLPPGAIAALLVFILVVNPALHLLSKKWTFSRNEMLTVYISCLFSCLTPGHGGENYFVPNIIGVYYFGNGENKWLTVWGHMKSWLSPALWADHGTAGTYGERGHDAVRGWYEGIAPDQAIPWDAWLVPLLAWGSLVLAIYILMACLSTMLRAQWSDREALAFPLLRLPLEMTEDAGQSSTRWLPAFFSNRLVWVGFAIAVFIQMLNGLHVYFAEVPAVPLEITGNFFTEAPWNQIDAVQLRVLPIAVGVAYLLTSEVSFSFWFFYWFIKVQYLLAYFLGFSPTTLPNALGGQGKVFTGYQHIGAYIAYVALVLWTAREHLTFVARRAFGRARRSATEDNEPLSYPVAFWGFVLALGFILGWSHFAGIDWRVSLWTWFCYLVIIIGLSRIIAEGGLLILESGWQPLGVVAQFFNSGPGTLLTVPNGLLPAQLLQSTFMVDMRGFLMPSFVQSFKLAHDRKIRLKPLLALIMAVTTISFVIGILTAVKMGYRDGGGLSFHGFYAKIGPQIPAWNNDGLLQGSDNAGWKNWSHNLPWLILGIVMTWLLMAARARFPGFPFHPIGLLVCLTSTIHAVWLSLFLGWLIKVTITKFGGIDAYRKLIPAALGLVLGDVFMLLVWLIVDGFTGRTGHTLGTT